MKFRELLSTVRGLKVNYPTGSAIVESVNLASNSCMIRIDVGCSYYVNVDRISAQFISDGNDCISIDIDELTPFII